MIETGMRPAFHAWHAMETPMRMPGNETSWLFANADLAVLDRINVLYLTLRRDMLVDTFDEFGDASWF